MFIFVQVGVAVPYRFILHSCVCVYGVCVCVRARAHAHTHTLTPACKRKHAQKESVRDRGCARQERNEGGWVGGWVGSRDKAYLMPEHVSRLVKLQL